MAITPLPTPAPSRDLSEAAFVAASNALFGALPGFVTEMNEAIDEINAGAVGQWTQIGSDVSTASGSSVTFANIPATYRDLRFEFAGVSPSTTADLRVEFSADGSTYSSPVAFLSSVLATSVVSGDILIADYRALFFAARATVANLAAAPQAGAGGVDVAVRLSGPLTHVRFSVSTGSFDSGVIRLKAR